MVCAGFSAVATASWVCRAISSLLHIPLHRRRLPPTARSEQQHTQRLRYTDMTSSQKKWKSFEKQPMPSAIALSFGDVSDTKESGARTGRSTRTAT